MSGCIRPCLCSVPMKSVLPAARSVRMSRSKRELAQEFRWIAFSVSFSTTTSASLCCTTAGNCLWSPININRSIARLSACRTVSKPIIFGSNIWLASSMIARSKCLILKRAALLFIVEVVATTMRASAMVDFMLLRVALSSNTSFNKWSLYFGSQLNSLPMRI